ncbi:MAG: TIGR00153 family protein [Deltaproteobacteria bacterium]|nr:TIGR00153 family protein [Deltaproteobacteria bacterium]MBW2638649.1 TIGR00153 family protein [Deltaproteobacteria bacterium]MBW2680722.1 TIGR00153 family protein [Deltaproteobacteria bacterium]
MRVPFFKMFMTSPFEGLQEHAEKVMECAWAFQQAMECYFSDKCKTFEEFRQEVTQIESQADVIKRRIRGHIPKETMMPISNFLVFRYLREQDGVLDAVEDTLDWISYRSEAKIPEELKKDFAMLVDSVIDSIEMLSTMVAQAREYFNTYSEDQRVIVKDIIHKLRRQEHEADKFEDIIKKKVFNMETDAVTIIHLVRLAEIIGSIADHSQNAGDMMRAMLSR